MIIQYSEGFDVRRTQHVVMLAFVAAVVMVLSMHPSNAFARRQLVPEQPSIEVNLEVLRDLANSPSGQSRFHAGLRALEDPRQHQAQVESSPHVMRKVPTQNKAHMSQPALTNPQSMPFEMKPKESIKQAPKMASLTQSASAPRKPRVEQKPRPSAQPRPTIAMPPEEVLFPAKEEPKAQPMIVPQLEEMVPPPSFDAAPDPFAAPPNSSNTPAVAALPAEAPMDDLPQPDMDEVQFSDFPDMPAMDETPSAPSLPQTMEKGDDLPPMMPSLDKGLDDFMVAAPAADDVAPPPAMPDMPIAPAPIPQGLPNLDVLTKDERMAPPPVALPDVADAVPLPALGPITGEELPSNMTEPLAFAPPPEMPAIPTLSEVEMGALPSFNDPAAGEMAPVPTISEETEEGQRLTIEFSATENELPVSAQAPLKKLANELKKSGDSVRIRPYVAGDSQQSALGNVIGTRRAFAVRTFLIDQGVSHFNISIDRSQPAENKGPERVDLDVIR